MLLPLQLFSVALYRAIVAMAAAVQCCLLTSSCSIALSRSSCPILGPVVQYLVLSSYQLSIAVQLKVTQLFNVALCQLIQCYPLTC